MPEKITATYRIVTPMFIGDAEQKASGISPASVKGALRFWWRALNWGKCLNKVNSDAAIPQNDKQAAALRELHAQETKLFGGLPVTVKNKQTGKDETTGGQGAFLLRVQHEKLKSFSKNDVPPNFKPIQLSSNGQIKADPHHLAGARYLGYGLMVAFTSTNRETGVTRHSGQLERGCLDENQNFTVELIFRRDIDASIQDALIAWGLLGGLGSRSRHGMGSIALVSLNSIEQWKPPTDENSYVALIKKLFSSPVQPLPATEPPFSAFWEQSRIDRLLSANDPYAALDAFGKAMLMYRSWGRSQNGSNKLLGGASEQRFKDDHDWFREPSWATKHPNFHPERVVFGLPHNYHKDHHHVTPEKHERRSSPLLFHVHPVGTSFIGISIFLPAQFLPDGEKINANDKFVSLDIKKWSNIIGFLDGKIGNPPLTGATARFPHKIAVLP